MTAPRRAAVRHEVCASFEEECVTLRVDALLPMKITAPGVKATQKYRQIVASVSAVGLIEPPAVLPDRERTGRYYILDGHLRVEALRDLGVADVRCMVALSDDTYTYNKRVNRLSVIQEHKMIVKAAESGLTAELIATTLGVSAETILYRFRLLRGICREASDLLADKPCPVRVFEVLRRMTPIRQIEAAELMVGHNSYGSMFVAAILASTPADKLVTGGTRSSTAVSSESMARIERELVAMQAQNRLAAETYGRDVLHLTVARGYIGGLLAKAPIVRWLAKHRPEYLSEFQNIAEMTAVPGAGASAEGAAA